MNNHIWPHVILSMLLEKGSARYFYLKIRDFPRDKNPNLKPARALLPAHFGWSIWSQGPRIMVFTLLYIFARLISFLMPSIYTVKRVTSVLTQIRALSVAHVRLAKDVCAQCWPAGSYFQHISTWSCDHVFWISHSTLELVHRLAFLWTNFGLTAALGCSYMLLAFVPWLVGIRFWADSSCRE